VSIRLAAVEGLRLAASPVATSALRSLSKDDEDEVRRTVQLALEDAPRG